MKFFSSLSAVVCYYLIFYLNLNECRNTTGLEKLIERVFDRDSYNLLVRPVDEKTGLTVVSTELKIHQIDLDEKYEKLVSTVWLEMTWDDVRFRWDPIEYDNITEITLPASKLWTPDIVIQNGVGRNEYLMEMKYFNPWISHTGTITWVPEIRIHTKCIIKVADFPFDTQCCEIAFYSWAHTVKQMTIQQFGNKNITNTTHLNANTEWEVYHTCASNKTIETSEDLYWWVTNYVLYMKRNSSYHIYNLIMPCLVLSLLSILLYLLPPDSGEKITLGVTILLAFFVNSLVVTNYTPEAASDYPVIGIYYFFNIGLVSVSVGASVCVLNLHFRGHRKSRVPKWVKIMLLMKTEIDSKTNNVIEDSPEHTSITLSNAAKKKPNKSLNNNNNIIISQNNHICNNLTQLSKAKSYILYNNKNELTNRTATMNGGIGSPIFIKNPYNQLKNENNQLSYRTIEIVKEIPNHDTYKNVNSIQITHQTKSKSKDNINQSKIDNSTNQLLEKILKLIKQSLRILEKNREKMVINQSIYEEWKEVATRVDFVLFIVSATVVFTSPIALFGRFYLRDKLPQSLTCECNLK